MNVDFWRSRVLQQTFNIPQMIPGGVTITFQFYIVLQPQLYDAALSLSSSILVETLFSEIDNIPQPPDTLNVALSAAIFTSSILVTSP